MIAEIVKIGTPSLLAECAEVLPEDIKAHKWDDVLATMMLTMKDKNGVGIAAPQIGVNQRIIVVSVDDNGPQVFFNPLVDARMGSRTVLEGCLSVPGRSAMVNRSRKIRVTALDRFGEPVTIVAQEDLMAQCLEHEIDHLNGRLFLSRVVRKVHGGRGRG